MKTKHFFLTLIAAVCCLSMFTACGGNDDSETEPDYTRAYVAMNFSFQLTEDMLKYCYVELSISNGKGDPSSKVINADDLSSKGFCYAQITAAFPAIFTLDRKVTLKTDVDFSKIESIKYATGYQYETGYFNASYQYLSNDPGVTKEELYDHTVTGTEFAQLVNEGKLNRTFTFNFDNEGKMTVLQ